MSKDATLAQGNQVMNLILQKKLTTTQLQKLFSTGYLSMLLTAAQSGKMDRIDPFKLKKALGISDSSKVCFIGMPVCLKKPEVHYSISIKDLLRQILPELSLEDVSILGTDDYEEELGSSQPYLGLVTTDSLTVSDALEYLKERGYASANRRELFTYLANTRNKMIKEEFTGRIIAAGSTYTDRGGSGHPFILVHKGVIGGSGVYGRVNYIINGSYLLMKQRL